VAETNFDKRIAQQSLTEIIDAVHRRQDGRQKS
jgi:hypothetical protein